MSSEEKQDSNVRHVWSDRGKINIGGKETQVISVGSYPVEYESFDLLKGSVLEQVEGNKLRIRKNGSPLDLYIHELCDIIYPSTRLTEPNDEVYGFKMPSGKRDKNPLSEFINKTITDVQKKYYDWWPGDEEKDLPSSVRIFSYDSRFFYEISGDDGVIFIKQFQC